MKSLHWPAVVFSVHPQRLFTLQGLAFRNTGSHRLDVMIGPKDAVEPILESHFGYPRSELEEDVQLLTPGVPWSQAVISGTILQVDDWWVVITNATRSQLTVETWTDESQPLTTVDVPASLARRIHEQPPGRNGLLQE
jgi:hypothetical protein